METTRLVQLAGVIFCLVLIISEICYCYPPHSYYSSADDENVEQGYCETVIRWKATKEEDVDTTYIQLLLRIKFINKDAEEVLPGVREMLEDWERQGLIRSLLPNKPYLPRYNTMMTSGRNTFGNRHEIMTRKSQRSASNSRLRYGKRGNLPQFEQIAMSGGAEDSRASSSSSIGDTNGNHGNWKIGSE